MIRFDRAFPVVAFAVVVGGACGGESAQPGAAQQSAGGPGGSPRARTNVVEVLPVVRGSIARQVTVPGAVEPLRTVGVNSQLAGALTAVAVEEGTMVRRGAVLARLDDREVAAQLVAAEAALQVAEAAAARAEQLRDRKVITLPEYERERTALASTKAQVEQLRARRGYATVVAPTDGVIIEKQVETGDVVGNNARLFVIADVSELVVRVGVSELDVVQLRNGEGVTITLDAFPNRDLRGRIRRIFPTADPATRLVPVEVVLDGEAARIARAGFLARVTFDLASSDNVLLLPVSAVLGGQGSQAVFVVDDNNTATRRTVVTGLTSRGQVEIVSGLAEGEKVVITGQNALRDGMTVRVAGQGGSGAAEQGAGAPADQQPRVGTGS
jgi:membrane fusion protein (multidrug efflux system)